MYVMSASGKEDSGGVGGAYSFVACLSLLTIDYASLSRWSMEDSGGGEIREMQRERRFVCG